MFTPAIGLSTHIWNNNARALLLLAGFPLLLAFMAFGISVIFAAGSDSIVAAFADAWHNLPWFFGLGLILAGAWFAIALATHQRIMDWITGAHPVTRESDKRLWDLMETLCISRGETMPRLGLIETQARNAFASGLSRKLGVITVTRGLVDALDDRELSAVLAHELVHIRNGDARLAVIAAIFSGIMTLGFGGGGSSGGTPAPPPREEAPPPEEPARRGGGWRWLPRGRRSGSSNNSGLAIVIIIIGIIIIIVAATLSVALRLALSRNREYLADAGAVAITGDADAMINALRRIEAQAAMPNLPGQVQAMLLHSASGASGPSLWSTHPPIADRIAALVRFAGGRDPGPIAEVAPLEAPEAPAASEALRAEGPIAGPTAGPWAQTASPLSEELARLRARRDNGA
ncbi:MAG: M48 family metalloprotease [Alphaproteobacteria bacterium]|nr:M48 family metalloprotease [Alphaproteobacteria bacterium]